MPEEVGAVIGGRHELIYELGRGQSGGVFVGIDLGTRDLNAIKVIEVGSGSALPLEILVDGLWKAAKRQARLRTPHILKVHDVGMDSVKNLAFVVTGYVPCQSLASRLDSSDPGNLQATLRTAREIASALDALHAQKMAHGMVKPGNILIPSAGGMLLADAGFYPVLEAVHAARETPDLPHYLAPECETDGQQPRKPPADVYAFGVILFRLLVGRWPFEANTAGKLFEVRRRTSAPKISEIRHREDIPPNLDHLVEKCLRADPAKRYQRGGEIMHRIDSLLRESNGETRQVNRTDPDLVKENREVKFPHISLGEFPAALVDAQGQIYPLHPLKDVYLIGRAVPGNEVDVDLSIDKSVSRQHARIFQQGGKWAIRDVSGRNQTWTNGKPVPSSGTNRLKDGDICRFSGTQLLFRLNQ